MRFEDKYFSREHRYALGIEATTDKRYLSIPVSNRMVDYDEYYDLDLETYERLMKDKDAAARYADECRRHERDDTLILKPGADRGSS